MARGTGTQQNIDNANATGYQKNASGMLGLETPVIQGQLQNPGFDAATSAAIRQAPLDATNSAMDAAKFSAAQRAGSTGNESMAYASANDLANKRAAALSTDALNSETEIGKQKVLSQQQAISDASQLYGTMTGAATTSTGQAGQMAAATPSVLQDLESGLQFGGQVAGGVGGLISGGGLTGLSKGIAGATAKG